MKNLNINIIITFLLLIVTNNLKSQNINFIDTHFETILLSDPSINTNGDNSIQKSEAMSFTGGLYLNSMGIHNLSGIEYFTQIRSLSVSNNLLTNVDLSNNKLIEKLEINNNKLTGIDVTQLTQLRQLDISKNYIDYIDLNNNIYLEVLKCSYNTISELELFNNEYLVTLKCDYNEIYTLDLSDNSNLTILYCSNNNLTTLNIANSNNINMGTKNIDITNNDLNCVQVDSEDFSNQNWVNRKDVNTYFSVDCNSIISDENNGTSAEFSVYPNPATDVVNIDMGGIEKDVDLEIMTYTGLIVLQKKYDEIENTSINLDNLSNGSYIIKVKTEDGKIDTFNMVVN